MRDGHRDLGRGAAAVPRAQRLSRRDLPHLLLQPALRRRQLGRRHAVRGHRRHRARHRRAAPAALLRELSAATRPARDEAQACEFAVRALAGNAHDLPFVLRLPARRRRRDARASSPARAASSPAARRRRCRSPSTRHASPWPFREVLRSGEARSVEALSERCGAVQAGPGPSRSQRRWCCRWRKAAMRTASPACWSPASARGGRSTRPIAAFSGSSPGRSRARSPTRAPTRTSGAAPRRWPSWTAPRRRSSPTSATSSARR